VSGKAVGPVQVNHGWFGNLESTSSEVKPPADIKTVPFAVHIPRSDENLPMPLYHHSGVPTPQDFKSVPFSGHVPRSDSNDNFQMPLSRELEVSKTPCNNCYAAQHEIKTHQFNQSQVATNHRETGFVDTSNHRFLSLDSNVGLIPRSDDDRQSSYTQSSSGKIENQPRKNDTVEPDEFSFKNSESAIPRKDEEPVVAPIEGSKKVESIAFANFSGADLPLLSPKSKPVDLNSPDVSSQIVKNSPPDNTESPSMSPWLLDFGHSFAGTGETGLIPKSSDSSSFFDVLKNSTVPDSTTMKQEETINLSPESEPVGSNVNSSVVSDEIVKSSPSDNTELHLVSLWLSDFGQSFEETGLVPKSSDSSLSFDVLNNSTLPDSTTMKQEETVNLSPKSESIDSSVNSSVVSDEIVKSSPSDNTESPSVSSWLLDLSQSFEGSSLIPSSTDSSSVDAGKESVKTADQEVRTLSVLESESGLLSKSSDSSSSGPVESSNIPFSELAVTEGIQKSLINIDDVTTESSFAEVQTSLSVTKDFNESPSDSSTIASITLVEDASNIDNRGTLTQDPRTDLKIESSDSPSESKSTTESKQLIPSSVEPKKETESVQTTEEENHSETSSVAADEAVLVLKSLDSSSLSEVLDNSTTTDEKGLILKNESTVDVTTESVTELQEKEENFSEVKDVSKSPVDSTTPPVNLMSDFNNNRDNLASQQDETGLDLKSFIVATSPVQSTDFKQPIFTVSIFNDEAEQVLQTKPNFETSRKRNYRGYRVYRVYLPNDESVQTLLAMEIEQGFEFWAEPRLIHRRNSHFVLTAADVIVAPSMISKIENVFLEAFLSFSILVEDVEVLWLYETQSTYIIFLK
jgi:hypothetical protein